VFSLSVFFTTKPFRYKLFKSSLLSAAFISGLLASFCSYSAKNVDIYTIEELVINQSDEVRIEAATRALATVFVRLAGTKTVLEAPAVRAAINDASIYVTEFGYQQTNQLITIAGASQPANRLLMRFAQSPIEDILKNNQLPIWLSNRPEILVWGALDSGGKSFMNDNSTMASALKNFASLRGLPITNPVLDLNDRKNLSVSRLWALDEDAIRNASSRYDTDAILAGRFAKSSSQWTANVLLLHRGKANYFSATASSQNEVASIVIDKVTDHLADIYAVSPNISGNVRFAMLQINNVSDFNNYAAVIAYLQSLPLIETLDVKKVYAGQLLVRANLNSSVNRLMNTINLDRKLTPIESSRSVSNPSPVNPVNPVNPAIIDASKQVQVLSPSLETLYEFVWQE
jgi:hypothetical protein